MYTSKKIFRLVVSLIAVVHCLVFIEMLYLDVKPMMIYNVFSIASYLLCLYFVHKESYSSVFLFAYLEVILHSFIAAVCVGWMFGFTLYMVALVPVGFYMEYFVNKDRHNIKIPFLLGLLDLLIYLSCQVYSDSCVPIYNSISPAVREFTYCFNAVCAFGLILCFSAIFIQELNYNHDALKEINEKLGQMAKVDMLTGLFNRRGIKPFLDASAASGRKFCIGLCDIDDFKNVNDSYGHEVGDMIIAETARIIRADIKPNDHVCRWGGEEFVFLIDDADMAEGSYIAEKIRMDVENRMLEVFGKKISFTITTGITEYISDESVEQTISRADKRMYYGKRKGKNVVVDKDEEI